MQDKMLQAYFRQTLVYHSDSKGDFIKIEDMHPVHAMNATEKLAKDAGFWARQAGVKTSKPNFWMFTQPLFQALIDQADQ
jgi:hypothetical protein